MSKLSEQTISGWAREKELAAIRTETKTVLSIREIETLVELGIWDNDIAGRYVTAMYAMPEADEQKGETK